MLKNIAIKTRLVAIIGFLLLCCLAIGTGGLASLGSVNGSLKTVYEDRLVAMGQLDRVVRLANRHQLVLAKALTGDPAKISAEMDGLDKDIADGDQVWAAYSATYLTPEEKLLVADYNTKRNAFIAAGIKPAAAALRAHDLPAATALVQGAIDKLYAEARVPLTGLIALQMNVGKAEYDSSQTHFQQFRLLTMFAIALAAALGIAVGVWLIRSITIPLNVAIRTFETEEFRIIEPPSLKRGRAFCTAKNIPFTFTSKVWSKCPSVATASGAIVPAPAFAKSMSM